MSGDAAGVVPGTPGAPGVVTLGETMLQLVAGSPVVSADLMRVHTGGAESNTAIALAHLGVPVTWIGRLGADPAGDRVLADIEAEGVVAVVTRDRERSTGIMMKERLADGRTRVTYHRRGSAGAALAPTDVPAGLVESAALLHCTGITLALGDPARGTLLGAIDRARGAGVPIAFDVNHRRKLIDDAAARERYRTVATASSIVFAGDDEARLVLGLDPDDADVPDAELALRLADLATGRAVVKLGSRGAVAAIDGQVLRRAATPVRVVDPIGAGDAFVAGYLAARLAGDAPAAALDRAADAGALACTVPGDWHAHGGVPVPHQDPAAADIDAAVHDRVER